MFIYIVGVTKQNPNSADTTVQARVYTVKPEATVDTLVPPRPIGIGASDFNFQVSADQVGAWVAKIGTYAEFNAESFA